MGIIGEIGVKVKGRVKQIPQVKRMIEKRVAETEQVYKDVVEFTHHQNPPEMKIKRIELSKAGVYNGAKAEINIHPIMRLIPSKTFKGFIIAHELKHSKQFDDIARAYAGKFIQAGKTAEEGLLAFKKCLGNPKSFNKKHFKKVIKTEGILKPGTPKYKHVVEIYKAFTHYQHALGINDIVREARHIHANTDGFKKLNAISGEVVSAGKRLVKQHKDYRGNLTEVEARQASKEYLKNGLNKDSRFLKIKAGVQKAKKLLGLKKPDMPRRADNPA